MPQKVNPDTTPFHPLLLHRRKRKHTLDLENVKPFAIYLVLVCLPFTGSKSKPNRICNIANKFYTCFLSCFGSLSLLRYM